VLKKKVAKKDLKVNLKNLAQKKKDSKDLKVKKVMKEVKNLKNSKAQWKKCIQVKKEVLKKKVLKVVNLLLSYSSNDQNRRNVFDLI